MLYNKNYIFIILLAFLSLGFTTNALRKNPCRTFLQPNEADELSLKELKSLENILKKPFRETQKEGCRNALLGQVALRQGKTNEAANYFHKAQKILPKLSDYFLLAQARAELEANNILEAQTITQTLLNRNATSWSTHFKTRIDGILAHIALKEKNHQQIIKTQQKLLGRGLNDEHAILFNLGTELSHVGESAKADEIFKEIIIRFPSSKEAENILSLKELSYFHLNLKESEQRFKELIKSLAFDKVVSEVDEIIINNDKTLLREEKSILSGHAIKSLMLNNKFDKGLKRAHEAITHDATAKDLENYAWGLARVNHPLLASDVYARFSKKAKKQEDKARGCFFAGFSLYEASLYSMAQLAWHRCQGEIEGSSVHESYLWYRALVSLLQNDPKNAYEELLGLKHKFKKSAETDKYQFFLGYSLEQMHKKDQAQAFYEKLSNRQKPNYYTLLARKKLKLKDPKGNKISMDALNKNYPCQNNTCKNALTLYGLGFKEEARDLVLTNKMPLLKKLSFLNSLGFHHDVFSRAHLIRSEFKIIGDKIITDPTIRFSYPTPYDAIVDQMSKKYNIEKNLILAIMGIESGFMADAVSTRGARGLMQIMPFVAHDLAPRLSKDKFTKEKLKDPKVAIELGTLLLATLKRQFGKNHMFIAAYNAGAHHVQKWHNDFGHLPKVLRVERINFEQTRAYVKKVLEAKSILDALDGEPMRLIL